MNVNGQSTPAPWDQERIFGYPKGLYVLFFTELWERFSYYGMRAILILFITSSVLDGGLGWTQGEALNLYANYTMFVYLVSIPGGFLADRVLGQKKAVMIGGGLLVLGHGVMAIPQLWSFYAALALIVAGVGFLKPNISTMVGGLYKPGDPERDKGFTFFYIGINIGAFLSGITVALVAGKFGWHAGFGLAGIGMLLGQIVFIWGQKYLKGVGDYVKPEQVAGKDGKKHDKPLTKIEKDRVVVLLLSFLIVIVFWGAFEQAGGSMNLYAQFKSDRVIDFLDYTVPAGVFQSLNAMYIIIFGMIVAGFWASRALKGKETSTLLKMGIGTIIMGLGFLFMSAAAAETQVSPDGKSMLIWLFLAYLFHTLGELCLSPTSLSFITKLAPLKYASLIMGIYWAATGIGNKLAGELGKMTTVEPIKIELNYQNLEKFAPSTDRKELGYFIVDVDVKQNNGELSVVSENSNQNLYQLWSFASDENQVKLNEMIRDIAPEFDDKVGLVFRMNPEEEKEEGAEILPNDKYNGVITVEQVENRQQLQTFTFIAGFAILFGVLLLVFFKKLKKLTHSAEDLNYTSDDDLEEVKKESV